jgi:sugar lactone lactonase YvrE
MRKSWLHVCALILSLSLFPWAVHTACALSMVTFLGSDPKLVTPSPVAIADLAGGGIDADGNGYYADNRTGSIIRYSATGVYQTLLSGLKQPHIAVDYRGNLFIADTGNNRVLSLAAGATEAVVRAKVAGPSSIAVDASGNIFFLSGGALFEIIGGAQPRKIGAFPDALFLAYGPDTGENDTIYILSASNGPSASGAASNAEAISAASKQYSVSTYAYHSTDGAITNLRSFQTADTIEDFGVDAAGNLIFGGVTSVGGQARTYLFEISAAGDNLALTQPVTGKSIHLALDYNRVVYYADAQGIFQLMKGSIDFGTASQGSGGGEPNTLTLNFSLPAGVAVAGTSYTVDGMYSSDFQDGFPFNASCSAGSAVCSMPVSYLPSELGITAATMSLLDASGNTLIQVPLHGVGMYPMHELFIENELAAPDPPTSGVVREPAGICTTTSLGPMVTDLASGSVFTPYSTAFVKNGLGKPETVAHLPAGNTYVTQAGKAGVLAIRPDRSTTRVASRLVTDPNGVAVDGTGNLFISDRNSIFRLGLDGVETELASAATDGGYSSVQSIAVDPAGVAYAYFGWGGPGGRGGLVSITPTGVVTTIPTKLASAAGLAMDIGGGLYFTDTIHKSLETLRTNGTWMNLLTGLTKPLGVTALYGPLITDEGSEQLIAPTIPQSAFDFGNVPVGTTATKTFTVFALGNAQTTGGMYFDGFDAAFDSGAGYKIDPGGSQTVTISFTPSYAGPHSDTMYDEANDFFSEEPIVQQYTVTGVGVAPSVVSAK